MRRCWSPATPRDAAQAQALLALARTTAEELQMQGLMPHLLEMHSPISPALTLDDVPGVVHARASASDAPQGQRPNPVL